MQNIFFRFLFSLFLCLFKDKSGAKDGLTGFSCSDKLKGFECTIDMSIENSLATPLRHVVILLVTPL